MIADDTLKQFFVAFLDVIYDILSQVFSDCYDIAILMTRIK